MATNNETNKYDPNNSKQSTIWWTSFLQKKWVTISYFHIKMNYLWIFIIFKNKTIVENTRWIKYIWFQYLDGQYTWF